MSEEPRCPRCNALLGVAAAPGGHCPQCLLLLGLEEEPETRVSHPREDRKSSASTAGSLSPGTRLGRYEVLEFIGRGGMGEVYRGVDSRLGRRVAIKVLAAELSEISELRQRFEREAQTISKLTHPHICTLYDVAHESGVDFLVMELLDGETLAQRLKRGPLSTDEMLEISTQLVEGLERAHRLGVIHRDLKPGNVMLTDAGAKLLDFGLAKIVSSSAQQQGEPNSPTITGALTGRRTVMGTLQYMSPEQLLGEEVDPRSDLFSLGAVLYEMATGVTPFDGPTEASIMGAILHLDPPPASSARTTVPRGLDAIIARCLAKNRADRYSSPSLLLIDLRQLQGGSGPRLQPVADAAEHPSIAVLPFHNLSGDPQQELFADGLAEDLITQLSRSRQYPIVSRNAAFAFRGQDRDLEQLSRALGARYVVDGSVRASARSLRVNAQLVEAATGRQVWAERYDRNLGDVLALQDELAEEIASALRPVLDQLDRDRAQHRESEDLSAWDTAQQAWWHLYRFERKHVAMARSLFERAVALDPRLLAALYGLSMTYYMDLLNGWSADRERSVNAALEAAERCLTLDENDPMGHIALGCAYSISGPAERAVGALRIAVELNPASAWAKIQLGTFLALSGRPEEAIAKLEAAGDLGLEHPLRWSYVYGMALARFASAEYEEAAEHCRRCLDLRPGWHVVRRLLAATLVHLDRLDEARQALVGDEGPAEQAMQGICTRELRDRWQGALDRLA